MSMKYWHKPLRQMLRKLRRADRVVRVAVVGIGHELRGDDAAGVILSQSLERLIAGYEEILVIAAGSSPENCTAQLRRFDPDCVLLLDAAQMGEKPGTVRWLSWQSASGVSATTHTLPLSLIGSYLSKELDCEVALLGIQPASIKIGTPLSPAVQTSVEALAEILANILSEGKASAKSVMSFEKAMAAGN
jgi:hydrogenase 3 maturation protease